MLNLFKFLRETRLWQNFIAIISWALKPILSAVRKINEAVRKIKEGAKIVDVAPDETQLAVKELESLSLSEEKSDQISEKVTSSKTATNLALEEANLLVKEVDSVIQQVRITREEANSEIEEANAIGRMPTSSSGKTGLGTRKIKLTEKEDLAEKRTNAELENKLEIMQVRRILSNEEYKVYFSRKRIDININCVNQRLLFDPLEDLDPALSQKLVQSKDLIGSTKLLCSRVDFVAQETMGRYGPAVLRNLYFGEHGSELTLFQWLMEFVIYCNSVSSSAFNKLMFKALERSLRTGEKSENFKCRKISIIKEFKAIESFLQESTGTIIMHEVNEAKFEAKDFEARNIPSIYGVYENKLLMEFLPEKRSELIKCLREAVEKLFGIEDLEKELQISDCISLSVVSNGGLRSNYIAFDVPLQLKILGYLAPQLSEEDLPKFLPRGDKNAASGSKQASGSSFSGLSSSSQKVNMNRR